MQKPKKVKETLFEKFTEDSDPIKDLGVGKLGMFKDLEKRGVKMWFEWGERSDRVVSEGYEEKLKTIENIVEITELVNKLEEAGFSVNKMSIYRAESVNVETVKVISSMHVIHNCATEEDADILINIIKKLAIWQYDTFRKDKGGQDSIPVEPSMHVWLDDLIENRKKYKKFI